MRDFGRIAALGAGRLLSGLLLFMTMCSPGLDRPIRQSVAEFKQHFQSIPFDPIQMTVSGRLHGWTSGDRMLAHLLMYEATGMTKYPEQFAERADCMLDLRNSERGLPDSLGRLLPVWKTGDRRLYEVALRWYMQHSESWKDVSPEAELYDPDPIAKQNNLRHRMRLGWAALAWTASQISE